MDPWAHYHRLGASPTDLPAKFHHVLAAQRPWRSNQHPWFLRRCIQGPADVPMPPPGTLGPPPTLPLPTNTPPLAIHFKQWMWILVEMCPIQFQALQASLSFLAQHQLQSSNLVVEQNKSGAALGVRKSLLGLVQLLCNSFISAFTLFSIYFSTLFQYYCFALL